MTPYESGVTTGLIAGVILGSSAAFAIRMYVLDRR